MANILKEVLMLDFLLTGTRVYGPAKPDSDLDIVVKSSDVIAIQNNLEEHNIPIYNTPIQGEYGNMGGFYFDLFGIQFNIVVAANEEDYNLWDKRTERMKTLPDIEDRDTRLSVFRLEEVR
jgi:hypothetical protein